MTPAIKDEKLIVPTKTLNPAKGAKTKEEKLKLFIDTFKAPKQGDINPKTGNKYTASTATKERNAQRKDREDRYYGNIRN